jgi:integrase
VTRAVQRFSPRSIAPATWHRIERLVRSSVEKAIPTTVYKAQALMTVVTELVVWVDTLGLPLDPGVVFHPDTIDRFAREGCAHLAGGTQFNYRRQLRAVGAAVLGPESFPPPPLSLKRSDPEAPYTDRDIAALLAWCRGLPTDRYRNNIGIIIALGLGAGLKSQELGRLRASDVVQDDRGVLVHVLGDRAREVPVLRSWERRVVTFAREAGDGLLFLPDRRSITPRQVPNFVARTPKGDAPPLNMVKLRVSWIVIHMNAGTSIKALEAASGVDASQLVKYSRYLEVHDADEVRRLLRDPGGP